MTENKKENLAHFFEEKKLNRLKCPAELKQRMQLIYWLTCPVVAVSDKYPKEVLEVHEKFTHQMLTSLSKVRNWVDYQVFLQEQQLRSDQAETKIAAMLHPTKRREQGLEVIEDADLYNITRMLGEPLVDLFSMETKFVDLQLKFEKDLFNMSIGDHQNYKATQNYFESFYKGCKWAIEDNNKVGNSLKYEQEQSFQGFVDRYGFTYLRYPLIHMEQKNGFLGYLSECSDIIAQTYGLAKNNVGFKQDGLELFTTKSAEAYYVPSLKNINLRLDMINAYFHEHFHALDHQIFNNINLQEIKDMFGRRGQLSYNLASEVKMIDPEKITESPSKHIMMEFNKITDALVNATDDNFETREYSQEEQELRRAHIVTAVDRFLNEIPQKLKIDNKPFLPVIDKIMDLFEIEEKPHDLMQRMEELLYPLTIEAQEAEYEEKLKSDIDMLGQEKPNTPFKQSHANYYIGMVGKIHALHKKLNNNTLFYNYSFINDNNRKGGYFASKPEMLARTAETYFFKKNPHLNITPPEWWESNSYLFYPQNEEIDVVCKVFEKATDILKENKQAFETDLGVHNKQKVYRL